LVTGLIKEVLLPLRFNLKGNYIIKGCIYIRVYVYWGKVIDIVFLMHMLIK
jgi:hypothetical protein